LQRWLKVFRECASRQSSSARPCLPRTGAWAVANRRAHARMFAFPVARLVHENSLPRPRFFVRSLAFATVAVTGRFILACCFFIYGVWGFAWGVGSRPFILVGLQETLMQQYATSTYLNASSLSVAVPSNKSKFRSVFELPTVREG